MPPPCRDAAARDVNAGLREEARRDEAGRARREAERRNTIMKEAQLISMRETSEGREGRKGKTKEQVASLAKCRASGVKPKYI